MKLATQISFGFLIAISIDLVDSFINYRLTLKVKANQEFFNRSQTVVRQSHELREHFLIAENLFKDFLHTSDSNHLHNYNKYRIGTDSMLSELKKRVTTSEQLALLDSITDLHLIWFRNTSGMISSLKKFPLPHKDTEKNIRLNDSVYRQQNRELQKLMTYYFRKFNDGEYDQRNLHKSSLDAFIDKTDRYSLFFSILLVLAAACIGIYLVRHLSGRIRSMVQLAERIANGDFGAVKDDKRDELTNLTFSLNRMCAQLSQNIGELEKKNTELNQFAYVVSHDLKAPVRGISNVVQWIREDLQGEITPEMQKYLDLIPERIARMENLINGLLAYARAGREGTSAEWVDVKELVLEIEQDVMYKPFLLQENALPVIYTQRLPLQQVLTNLIGNAVKYTTGTAMVVVSCQEVNGWHEFIVSDNGPGIAPEYHEKVFGLFQTLRQKNEKESTGIGLAIVRKIVEERGGIIRISSVPGNGAAFIFTWPIIKQ